MSIQIGILRILASHPDGFATIASINADIRLLSDREWSRSLRDLARRAGPISIFSERLVIRANGGWQITDAGRCVLTSLYEGSLDRTDPLVRLVASQEKAVNKRVSAVPLELARTG